MAEGRWQFFLQRLNVLPLDAHTRQLRRDLAELRNETGEQKLAWGQLLSAVSQDGGEKAARDKLNGNGVEHVEAANIVQLVEELFPQLPDTPTKLQLVSVLVPSWFDSMAAAANGMGGPAAVE